MTGSLPHRSHRAAVVAGVPIHLPPTPAPSLHPMNASLSKPLSVSRRHPAALRRGNRRGFTLLELLLVLAILVILGGTVAYNVVGIQAGASEDVTKTNMEKIDTAIKMYQIRIISLPKTLEELRDGPSDADKAKKFPSGGFLEEIPSDGWGNEINYTISGAGFELRSAGIDQQMNTDDDIVVSKK
ncbi:type II secretion system protein GspG [Stieleria bergensis]